MNDRKDHVFEQFRGALKLYYSPEVCYSLRSKDYGLVQHMVGKLDTAWESKSPAERARIQRHSSDWTPNYKKQDWNRPKDTASTDGEGGCPSRGKPARVGQGGSQRIAGSHNQGGLIGVGASLLGWVRVVAKG